MNIRYQYELIITSVVLVGFYIVYFNIIRTPYFHLDDALLFHSAYYLPSTYEDFFHKGGLLASIRGGRPFNAIGLALFSMWLDRTDNMDLVFLTMRSINLFSVSLSCALIAIWTYWQSKSLWLALALSFSIFLLPGYQVPIGDASPAVSVFGLIFATASILVLGVKHQHINQLSDLNCRSVYVRTFAVFMCLQMAFNSYQLYAFVFLFAPAYILLMSDMEIRKRVVVSLLLSGLFFVSIIFYYLSYKFVLLEWVGTKNLSVFQMPGREGAYPATVSHIISNIWYLFSIFFRTGSLAIANFDHRLFNLWTIENKTTHTVILHILQFGFIWCAIRYFWVRPRHIRSYIVSSALVLFVLLSIFLLGNIFNIRLEPNFTFRALAPVQIIVIIMLFAIFEMVFRDLKIVFNFEMSGLLPKLSCIFLITTTAFMAQHYVYKYIVLQTYREFTIVETSMLPFLRGEIGRIVFKRPVGNALTYGDEHGRLNLGDNNYTIHGMVQYLLRKNGYKYPGVYGNECPGPIGEQGNKIFKCMDFATLQRTNRKTSPSAPTKFFQTEREVIFSWPESMGISGTTYVNMDIMLREKSGQSWQVSKWDFKGKGNISLAFDANLDTNWESGPLPLTAEVLFPGKRVVRGYDFESGITPLMPTKWRVEGRLSSGNWVLIDTRDTEKPWQPFEKRSYNLNLGKQIDRIRFTITGAMSPGGSRLADITIR
jgi:hypothetical protein